MKRNLGLLLLLIAICGVAYVIVNRQKAQKYSSGVTPDRDFAIPTLDGVTNIVIKHAKLQPRQFQRKGNSNSWIIDGKYPASVEVVRNMTDVLVKMKLKYTPSRAASETAKKNIKEAGIKVMLYAGEDKPFKTFYIGSDTRESVGTYMMMENGAQVYTMHLPGVNGGFRSRFEQPLHEFRDSYVFKEDKAAIKSITVQYPKGDASSFTLTQAGENCSITPLVPNLPQPKGVFNQMIASRYCGFFKSLGAEGLLDNPELRDTITKKVPFVILTIHRTNGSVSKNSFYNVAEIVDGASPARTAKDVPGVERYVLYAADKEIYLCQNTVFKKIFVDYQSFFR
jgi:hypothetical protein